MSNNQFAGVDIHLPEAFREFFHRYCLTRVEGSSNNPEDSPFPRMVDMWFLGVCIAVKLGLSPETQDRGESYKAIEGVVFGSDDWRSNVLALVAIAKTGGADVISNPAEMMRVCNGYAVVGLRRLITLLEERGGDTALDYLCERMEELVA